MAFAQERERDAGLVDKLVTVKRVAKVVKGGRRFSFAAIVVVGDEAGRVGWGNGKAKELPDAVRKATDEAKRSMMRVPMREGRTIHHNIEGAFCSSRVVLHPAKPGTGIIAGGPMRAIFEAMGMKDVVAKSLGSNNPYNLIQATFEAFKLMETPRSVAQKRGLKMSDLRRSMQKMEEALSAEEKVEENAAEAKKAAAKTAAPQKDAKKDGAKKPAAKKPAPKAEGKAEKAKPAVKVEKKAEAVKAAGAGKEKAETKAE